jgi:hypothetical protein
VAANEQCLLFLPTCTIELIEVFITHLIRFDDVRKWRDFVFEPKLDKNLARAYSQPNRIIMLFYTWLRVARAHLLS